MRTAVGICVMTSLFLSTTAGAAEVPPLLHHQGFLTSSTGEFVTEGAMPIGFALFALPEGGEPLWEWGPPVGVEVVGGFYAVEIPVDEKAAAILSSQPSLYMEIRIGGETGQPRQRIGAVPYSLVCRDAVGHIHPAGMSIGNQEVVNGSGQWVGDTSNFPGVKEVGTLPPLTGGPIVDSGSIGMPMATANSDGFLAKEDFAAFSTKQPLVQGLCELGTCMVGVAPDGAVLCEPCMSIAPIPVSQLDQSGCTDGQVLVWAQEASSWTCGDDAVGHYSAGPGLVLSADNQFSLPLTCLPDELLAWTGDSWQCVPPPLDSGGTVKKVDVQPPLKGGAIVVEGTISLDMATEEQDGFLSHDDYAAFKAKQEPLEFQCDKGEFLRALFPDGSVDCDSDVNTTYTTGSGLMAQGTQFSLLLSCGKGNVLRWSGSDWACSPTVSVVNTVPPLLGGPITDEGVLSLQKSSSAQDGYLAQEDFKAFSEKQNRVVKKCPPNQAINQILESGGIVCDKDDSTAYQPGDGLAVVGTELLLSDPYLSGSAHDDRFVNEKQKDAVDHDMVVDGAVSREKLGQSGCEDRDLLRWDQETQSWVCDQYGEGPGLELAEGKFSLLQSCADQDVLKWDGSDWQCAPDEDTTYAGVNFAVSDQSCGGTEKVSGINAAGILVCTSDLDNDTIYSSGNGLSLQDNEFSLAEDQADGTAHDQRFVNASGDQMTGALSLPKAGLVVGENQVVVGQKGVGIGVNTPTQPLHVVAQPAGFFNEAALLESKGTVGIRLDDTSDAASLGYWIRNSKEYLVVGRRDPNAWQTNDFAWIN
jgi:hypothetical protein